MASYFLYARLDVHKKRLILPTTSWLRWPMIAIVSLFDWLLQIEIQHAPVDRIRFIDRSQKSYLGISAWIMLAANLPISFLFFYPMQVLLLVFRRGRWLEPVAASAIGRPQLSVFWLVPVLVAHLAFIFAVNATQQYRIAFDSGRLYDLPWYLAIMCLLSLIYGGRERRPSNPAVIGPVAAEELTSPPAQSGSI